MPVAFKQGISDLIPQQRIKFLDEIAAIEHDDALKAGHIGFMARSLIQATLPYRDPKSSSFQRRNGKHLLTIMSPPNIGLPYGTIPRIVLCWIITKAVQRKEKTIELGRDLSSFMRELDIEVTGGANGTITSLKNQMHRLFSSTLNFTYLDDASSCSAGMNLSVVKQYALWFDSRSRHETAWPSTITLSDEFFDEIMKRPVPINFTAFKIIKRRSRSPMALDIYCWLVYRLFCLDRSVVIPWETLQTQFGADFERVRDFKRAFLNSLRIVQIVYRQANVEEQDRGIKLKPSKLHIARRTPKACG